MNRFLIIGNGFDLAHKLPTRYSDFLYVCSQFSSSRYKLTKPSSDNIDLVFKTFVENHKNNEQLKIDINSNLWLDYFFRTQSNMGTDWVDFEQIIKIVCELYEKNDRKLIRYFPNEENININILVKEFNKMIKLLNEYLNVVNEVTVNVWYKEIIDFLPTDVISFNYTNTFNRIYDNSIDVEYIHGKIGNRDNNSIVLGIEGMTNEDHDVKYSDFIKYFQMIEKDINVEVYQKLQKFDDNSLSMFFGHSMNSNDQDIIKKIIKSSSKVVILYYNNSMKKQIIKNLRSMYSREEFVNLIFSKSPLHIFCMQGGFFYQNN